MTRFLFRLLLILGLGLAPITPLGAAPRPWTNFVLIFIDDMGYGDIGPFGSTVNRTPELDRMAAEGTRFTSFYAAPVCSASRAQLLTGCYAPRVSVPGVFFPAGPQGLNPSEHTIADYLKEQGYATMCVGKWHLGDQREFLPTRQGFDGYFGIPYSNDMGRTALDGRKVHPLMRDEEPAELIEDEGQRRITRLYTEEGERFIRSYKDRPFFLYLPHTAMHVPLFPHPDFAGKSNNGTYGDWVEEVDWSVGRILATLRELKLDENTLVLFTSDNGPWASKGKNGGVSGPLRGSKGSTLEGGVREPTIAWWPGKVPSGGACDAVAGTIDVLPTFVSLAGGKPRADVKIDGKDISDLLLGRSKESPHEAWYYYRGTKLEAVRSGAFKLALGPQGIGMGMKERPKDLGAKGPRLYNLDNEVGEITDVSAAHPEVVARLQGLAAAMAADIGNGKAGPGVRPAGRVDRPVTLYPTQGRGRGPKRPASPQGKPVDWNSVKPGTVIAPSSAPAIGGNAFTVTATVEGDNANGVIVGHGGSSVGYALYVAEGQLIFAYRVGRDQIVRVRTPLPAGRTSVEGGFSGKRIRVKVGEQAWVEGPTVRAFGGHPQEACCIGHDDANPVDSEAPKGGFRGKLTGVRVVVGR